jgi:hypothetical protein
MRKEDQSDPDALLRALMERDEVEETRDYVTRGRRHKSFDVDQLGAIWVRAFKTFISPGSGTQELQELSDSWAEFRLRRIEPPYHEVSDELRALQEEIWEDVRKRGLDNRGLAQKLEELLEEMRTKPKN